MLERTASRQLAGEVVEQRHRHECTDDHDDRQTGASHDGTLGPLGEVGKRDAQCGDQHQRQEQADDEQGRRAELLPGLGAGRVEDVAELPTDVAGVPGVGAGVLGVVLPPPPDATCGPPCSTGVTR